MRYIINIIEAKYLMIFFFSVFINFTLVGLGMFRLISEISYVKLNTKYNKTTEVVDELD